MRMTCMKYADADRIWQTIPLDTIPWNSETSPDSLVELVHEREVRSCKTIDLGCGAGNYVLYPAGHGFDVTVSIVLPRQ
jgi:hypothetical protein